jgi:hypothetical protein
VDWDGDGKVDVLLGTESAEVFFLRNIGTAQKPEFEEPRRLELTGMPALGGGAGKPATTRGRIAVADWNNDGKLDLLVGAFYYDNEKAMGGNVWLFLRK